jgi:hypothetical protein
MYTTHSKENWFKQGIWHNDSEIEDEPIEENVPTKIEGLQGLETVRRVLETHENVDEKLLAILIALPVSPVRRDVDVGTTRVWKQQ